MSDYMATTGTYNQAPDAPRPKRCLVCGAFGNAELCPKHFQSQIEAFDMHTDGAFSAFISAWKTNKKFRAMLTEEVKEDGGNPAKRKSGKKS